MRTLRRPRTDSTLRALGALSLFADATSADLAGLLAHSDLVRVAAGTVIGREGCAVRQLVGIVDGYVHGRDASGRTVVLCAGDTMGAAELIGDRRHDTTFVTSTATTLVVVFGPAFRALALQLPGVVERAGTPRHPVHARGVSTQNSLSSGSAMTTQVTSP